MDRSKQPTTRLSRATSVVTATATAAHAKHQQQLPSSGQQNSHRAKSWTSTSSAKFSRILNSLERSIMNQFNGNQTTTVDDATSTAADADGRLARKKFSQTTTTNKQQIVNISAPQPPPKPASKVRSEQAGVAQQVATSDKVDVAVTNKAALNKYQQQIVSTLRPDHQHNQLMLNSNNSRNSNKLSIPPPHANEEARNQNHRLIFGSPTSIAHTKHHSQQVLSPDPLKAPSESSTLSRFSRSHIINLDDAKQQQQRHNATSAKPNNLSPASSAKSLPVVFKTTSSLSNQNNNILARSQLASDNSNQQTVDDLESGFSTYQSRRSFVQPLPLSLEQQVPTTSCEQTTSNNTNMLIMQTTQVPMGSITSTSYNPTTNRQFLYQFQPQQQPLNTHHHQQQYLQPQQQFVTNHVPIVTTNSQIFTSNTLHHPATQHHQQFIYGNESATQASSGMANITTLAIDSGQEIYANAPPKPRRYQYYDLNQQHTMFPHLAPQSSTSSMTTNAITNGGGAISNNNNNTFIQYNRPLFPQQHQLIPNPTFKLSYLPAQNLQAVCPPFNNKVAQYVPQQVVSVVPHPLTKSKSSLDACDLMRFKLENRAPAARFQETSTLHRLSLKQTQPPSLAHYPSQQHLLYDSRLNNSNSNADQNTTANLQRSKSVTHLLNDCELHQMNQHLAINADTRQQPQKFLSVASASTTNLNFVGVVKPSHHQHQQLAKPSPSHQLRGSKSNNVQQPTQQDNHHQLYSATSLRQQQQRFSQQISKNFNDNTNNNNQTSVNTGSLFLNQAKLAAPAVIRQYQQLQEAGFSGSNTKPTLDDKIRYLMIGGTDGGMSVENKLHQSDKEVYQQQQQQQQQQHQTSSSGLQRAHPTSSWQSPQATVRQPHLMNNGGFRANEGLLLKKRNEQSLIDHLNNNNAFSNHHHKPTKDVTNIDSNDYNVIYSNDLAASKMGNRHIRQFQPNPDQLVPMLDASAGSQPDNADTLTRTSSKLSTERGPNSHLIVDLTTPRVLAKTQTTLPAQQQNTQAKYNKDSCSINQVGLPQLQSTTGNFISQQSIKKNEPLKTISTNNNPQQAAPPMLERTAPYYYSDLKSEEQRQALLSIVQQKSLSPPPQLLSRSTDLSSTRLTYKSGAFHPPQTRLSSDLTQSQPKTATNSNRYSPTGEFSSTLNITKNIDKLFESPMQPRLQELHQLQKIKPVRSMLDLNNGFHLKQQNQQQQQFQYHNQRRSVNLKAELESNDEIDYVRSKSFSKSKSLENLMSDAGESMLASDRFKLTVPVYENIRRSDKLMSAIHNSTTCLSTLTSRSLGSSRRTTISTNLTNGNNLDNNAILKTSTHSDDSLDSILGTSLDDSDSSSLDIIDEIKISPSDNHLSDIIQLIEQLKINHSKLSDEYKSIMIKIAKTINSNSSPASNVSGSNEKLGRRLQLLEMKSKKCESRSKNQLALIQMMEKVLKQSRVRGLGVATASAASNINLITSSRSLNSPSLESSVSGGGGGGGGGVGDSIESSMKQSTNQSISSASSDYQNVNSPDGTTADQVRPTTLGSSNNNNNITKELGQQQDPKAPIVKAVVTEATYAGNCISEMVQRVDKVVFDEMQQSNNNNTNNGSTYHSHHQQQQVSLSTRHQQNVKAAAGAMQTQSFVAVKDVNIGKKVTHIEQQKAASGKGSRRDKNKTNPFSSNDSVSSSGGNSSSSCSSGPNGSNNNDYEDDDEEVIDEEDMLDNSVDHHRQQQQQHRCQHHNRSMMGKQRKENDDEEKLTTSKQNGNGFDVMTRGEKDVAKVDDDGERGDEEEEEDFIEFLSTDGSSCLHHGGSQFEASQFSVSDFNTTSSTLTSESASSASGGISGKKCNSVNDSINLNLSTISNPIKHRFSSTPQPSNGVNNNPATTTATAITTTTTITANTGILKNGRKHEERVTKEKEKRDDDEDELEEEGEEELVVRSAVRGSSKKFNNVLGNVIDVDVCPMSKLSQSSPVNNQASSCLN